MILNRESVDLIASTSSDELTKALANALLTIESAYERMRQTLIVLAERAAGAGTLLAASCPPDSISGMAVQRLLTAADGVLLDKMSPTPTLEFEGGKITLQVTHWGATVLAQSFYESVKKDPNQELFWNNVELHFDHPAAGPMIVNVSRREGKTPNDLLNEEKARVSELATEVHDLRNELQRLDEQKYRDGDPHCRTWAWKVRHRQTLQYVTKRKNGGFRLGGNGSMWRSRGALKLAFVQGCLADEDHCEFEIVQYELICINKPYLVEEFMGEKPKKIKRV